MERFVEVVKDGLLRLNKAKIREEENGNANYLHSTSSAGLPAGDMALGYIAIEEISVRKGHKYLPLVMNLLQLVVCQGLSKMG